MRANPDRQRHLLHARDGGRRVPPAPSRGTLKTRKETMSAIWRSLVLKPKSATLSGQRTTTSMPNIISDRCAQTQKGRKRSCRDGPSRSPAGDPARSVRSRSNRRQDRRGALLYGWPAILTGTLDPLTSVLGACLIVRPTPHFFKRVLSYRQNKAAPS